MIISKFEDLRRGKAYAEGRKLTLRTLADESGVSLGTVHRISSGSMEGVRLTTLDLLCKYFEVQSINELIEFTPESDSTASAETTVTAQ